MAQRRQDTMTDSQSSDTRTSSRASKGFTAEERAEMPEADRVRGETIHSLIRAVAPELSSKTWYGMPAYAKDGNTICFFQPASKFKMRFAMLGFTDKAQLDDGTMWPVYYALTELT